MKHFPLLQNLALTCCAVAATLAVSSCNSPVSPSTAAKHLRNSSAVAVYSHDDAASPTSRNVVEMGALPERTARALDTWLRRAEVKTYSYAYPQYYIAMTKANGSQAVWGICSDGQGNMTGVHIPRDGRPAWMAPHTSELIMYVYNGDDRAALSNAIMESLADAGYDTFRINTRKASGLVEEDYLLSKPRSAEAQREYDLREMAKRQKEEKEAADAASEDATEDTGADDEDVLGSEEDDLGLDF